jgi:mono/diheme cytochrome c family protein
MAEFGKREYESKCASCHGTKGKGDGVVQPYLIKSARDLTTLAKDNGGVLPANALYEMISGVRRSAAHGTSEMPVWGKEYEAEFTTRYRDVPDDLETYTRTRILALIEYIDRLQGR